MSCDDFTWINKRTSKSFNYFTREVTPHVWEQFLISTDGKTEPEFAPKWAHEFKDRLRKLRIKFTAGKYDAELRYPVLIGVYQCSNLGAVFAC